MSDKKIKVYAHRAGNNLSALAGLCAAGICTVEGDVMFARDVPVMVHPAGLPRRLPDGNLDYEVEEVRAIVFGQDITMPTLQQVLEAMKILDMHLLLEVKIPGTVERIADVVRPFRDRVVIISFLGSELMDAATQHLETGPLMCHSPVSEVAGAMRHNYACGHFLMEQWYITSADDVRMLQAQQLEVVAYTVNDPARAQAMAALGVDAVLSDNPVLIAGLEGFEPG